MKTIFELVAPCHFGMEAVLKREIYDLGYEITKVEDGRVFFAGDLEAIARANIALRTAERVLLVVGQFHATDFDTFFESIRAIAWEDYIPKDGRFWVTKVSTIKSALFSKSDLQSLAKKAMVKRLSGVYGITQFPETGEDYPVRIFILKDEVTVALDTTGEPLHKRGYRTWTSAAPISETLAAALLLLTPWKADRILLDPFCGSGTFLIEAAMIAAHMAPGMNRQFTAMKWKNLMDPSLWDAVFSEARESVDTSVSTDLQGYDIDEDMVRIARANAKQAGVDHMIHFQRRDVADTSHPKKYGFIITNPPYGERLEDKESLPRLYRTLGDVYRSLDCWSMYVITSYERAQEDIGQKATKNRKIYNGMIRTYFYQYLGPKPPRRTGEKR